MKIEDLKKDYDLFIFEGNIATSTEILIDLIVWQIKNGYNCTGYEISCLKKKQVKDALAKAKADFDGPLGYFITDKANVLQKINEMIGELDSDVDCFDDTEIVYDFIYNHMQHQVFEIVTELLDEDDEPIEFNYNHIEILKQESENGK